MESLHTTQTDQFAAHPAFDARCVRVLWTGGWDSTYRLLQLLLQDDAHVVPYYVLRDKRPSTSKEMATMERIRAALGKQFPHTRESLEATQFCNVTTLAPDPVISEAYERTLSRNFLGRQYEWLAWFCTQNGIEDIELCVHRDDKAHAVLEAYTRQVDGPGGRVHRFDPRHVGASEESDDLHTLFAHFSFPLFEITKLQMAADAQANGWQDLMHMTWFCHSPRANGMPCGICHPCLYTVEEGLGHRLPTSSRVRSAVFRTCLLPLKGPIVAVLDAVGVRRPDGA